MSDLCKTTVFFNGGGERAMLLTEDDATVVIQAVVSQETAYNLHILNFNTGESLERVLAINGRSINYVDVEKFVPQGY